MAKSHRGKQTEIAGTDTPLSKAADDYLKARDGVKEAREEKTECEARLIDAMRTAHKDSVLHNGILLTVKTVEEKEIIKVKAS